MDDHVDRSNRRAVPAGDMGELEGEGAVVAAPSPTCAFCGRTPAACGEYAEVAAEWGWTVDEYVRREEGTYNERTNHFACTECYIAIGMPSGPHGWVAP